MNDTIKIIGARENNLKNIHLEIPKNKLIVFTGLSGSGKSTLAFGTLYAEGQRRYIESLSAYARQFLDKVGKPDVDKIEGLTPAIAIDQKTTSKNPRSTVGTITEIYDYLRLLYARVGIQHCHRCGQKISSMSVSDIVSEILKFPKGAKIIIYSPLIREKKGTYADLLENLRNKGYVRAQIDGVLVRLDEEIELAKTKKHTIKLVIDRLEIQEDLLSRLASDIEKGLQESFGEIEIEVLNHEEINLNKHYHFSEHSACFDCKISFVPLEPLSFSFNSPKGACEACDGLGIRYTLDMKKIIDENLSLENGAVKIMYGFNKSYYYKFLIAFCEQNEIPIKIPFMQLNEVQKRLVLYGNAKTIEFLWKRNRLKRTFEGVVKMAYEMLKDEKDLAEYMSEKICKDCGGHRLKPESLAVKVAKKSLGEILDMSIEDSTAFFADEKNFSYLSEQQKLISKPILKEINERLFFLYDVGLGYLSLGRDARTISGGEAQRIRIASQIGSGLSGVMYVLDEPSIGLHERDTAKLIKTLRNLQQKGNTLIVVEHDKMTIEEADFIVDIGPKAGKFGGEVVFSGTYKELLKSKSETALYMNGKKQISQLQNRTQKEWLELKNVNINNIQDLSVKFPLQNLVAITGVSGSGKSSLILQTLLPFAQEELNRAKKVKKLGGVQIEGLEKLDKVIYLDQSPIGRTPRSNPATYTGAMDEIRNLFAATKEAKMRGYKAGRFSFNVKGGRCEKCSGDGEIKIEMHFLPDVMVVCDTCGGKRYNDATLEIKYKGKNISEILNMSVLEASEFFTAVPKIKQKLDTLVKVGLDYLTLGQNATTLSGGEAQRIKLAKELSRSDTGKTLYILDEPTTGLHFEDVNKLILVLQHLVDLKNSVFVIEHNLDVIKNADYIIDMGPEGGVKGGKVISTGSVEKVAKEHKKTRSYTGYYLDLELKNTQKS
ncbi:excinuclease ABC subunit UvrA [Campylobacter jejuni]|uniref:UvrABC system protein A n=2 Tax=Campylobacter jejuni TaxID=197 RepID=Q0PBG7_CAMJE|nr:MULTISPECIES: excinuclease ABC subunit UvrA [Campylobacter]YP_002343780.1 excinuclease ABC subunit A [Campylobacter jejuni subsp. jejuni NCTC 11168 = ATCC 700819]APA80631.1 Excinuclease ABC subunit A [Campylobacter jejuni subsp. jejuni D42a]EAI3656287.1 excinuclease ABC subunit UvrA [Campylobacter fetus]EFV07180.1 excinuclease ABC, A subunit [Campylobacter jejuni subsp. jejuni DFVF1099]EFV09667.1 excinuclease ABC, A subunit [Campylobacter jejuni subsp. jejuni 305]ADC27966.1 excinuclease AB